MGERKERPTVSLGAEFYGRLHEASERLTVPMCWIVEDAVASFFTNLTEEERQLCVARVRAAMSASIIRARGTNALTEKQQAVYDFIAQYTATNKMPPTLREITEHFGWTSHHSALCHLEAMAKKGVILKADGRARAWRCA